MTLITKKNIATFKLYTKILESKKLLNNSKFILFYFFQFLNHKEQLALKKLLKQYNLECKIINKKTCTYIFKNTSFENLQNISTNNLLLIYSTDNNLNIIKNLDKMFNNNKLQLVAAKINNNIYRSSDIQKYLKLSQNIKTAPLLIINTFLINFRSYLNYLKIQ